MESARKLLLVQSPQGEFPNHVCPNARNTSCFGWLSSVSSFFFSISIKEEILTVLKAVSSLSKEKETF